jgi:2-methylcitrate dehydratase PrpD
MTVSVLLVLGILTAVFVGINIGGSNSGVAFGPAVAAAKLLNLDQQAVERALGIVGSSLEGSARTPGAEHGVRWISDGRPGLYKLGMGLKAFTGVLGALRATHGFPAPMAILDGHFWTGLGTDQFDGARLHAGLGQDYRIRTMAYSPIHAADICTRP